MQRSRRTTTAALLLLLASCGGDGEAMTDASATGSGSTAGTASSTDASSSSAGSDPSTTDATTTTATSEPTSATDVATDPTGATETTETGPTTDPSGTDPTDETETTGDPIDPIDFPPRIHPDDPHRLLRGDTPWYPAAYYPGAAVNMTGADYQGDVVAYGLDWFEQVEASGIDLFRIWFNWGNVGDQSPDLQDNWDSFIVHPYLRPGPGMAADGGPRFDLDQWNPEYFDLLVKWIDYARSRGVVIQVMLLDCWHVGFGLNWGFGELDYLRGPNNVNGVDWVDEGQWLDINGPAFARNVAFVEEVVATIGDRPNIIWETCNEKRQGDHSTPAASAADVFHKTVAAAIHAQEDALGYPRHLVMPVDLPEHRTVAGHTTPTQNGQGQESIPDMHARLAGEQFAWGVPLISDNDCCAGEPDADFIRRKTWAALAAGAHVDVFNGEAYKQGVLANQNTADGMRFVGNTRRFFEMTGADLIGMVPSDGLVDGPAWVYARPGDEYLIYVHQNAPVTVSQLPASYSATWFDPRQATVEDAGPGPTFTPPPDGQDWVLHVRAR